MRDYSFHVTEGLLDDPWIQRLFLKPFWVAAGYFYMDSD
jgi:hypothetical protein